MSAERYDSDRIPQTPVWEPEPLELPLELPLGGPRVPEELDRDDRPVDGDLRVIVIDLV